EGMRATVYDMIARRSLATLSSPSLSTITEVHLRLGDTEFLAVGGVLVEPGWREILPDDRPMTELPALREGEELTVREVRVVEDRTTPPPLHTQGTLLLTMQRLAPRRDVPGERLRPVRRVPGRSHGASTRPQRLVVPRLQPVPRMPKAIAPQRPRSTAAVDGTRKLA